MNESQKRPGEGLIKKVFQELTGSVRSREELKNAALAGKLFPTGSNETAVAGRSLAWKIFLISREPLDSAPVNAVNLLETLQDYRKQYTEMFLEQMRAPDGSYEESVCLQELDGRPRRRANTVNLETNNPLSLHDENPWRQWFQSVELRKTILQDVERTFPDMPFFRDSSVQARLTEILFLYSVMNPSIGYRQGMHELLAPLYYAVEYDSITCPEDEDASTLQQMCSRNWIAADSWALFTVVTKGVSRWYEWREAPDKPPDLPSHIHIDAASGQTQLKPYAAPIIQICNLIQSTLLKAVDPLLWEHVQRQGIEPQIYGIRWLRLLFTREFDMPNAMKLWDSLFAADPTIGIAPWICVAMLIRIRSQLLSADYSGQLALLLHYPTAELTPSAQTLSHTSLLVKQALALQLSPKPSTGAITMLENNTLLDIPVEVAVPQRAPRTRPTHVPRAKSASTSFSNTSNTLSRQQAMNIPEMITRGLLDRGESLGINKTVMNAVSELKKSMPDLTVSFSRSPPDAPSYPLSEERPVVERPPWEPRTRFEVEREMSQLRSNNKRLGEALGWVVDLMLQDEGEVQDLERLRRQRREALESLAYVRDALMGHVTELEDERLFGEEEVIRRREKAEMATKSAELSIINVPAPAPVPVIDSRSRLSVNRKAARQTSVSAFQRPMNNERLESISAPWNYTQSTFSGSNKHVPGAALPRLPPATSKTTGREQGRKMVGEDPLGVVNRAGH